ncbi:MAG TPA: 30S ribosome-binding factor RbfA [Acidimicrobiales bacterium]
MSGKRPRLHGTARDYPRTARLNHLVQEIVADEIERLEDDRLGLFTVVAVDVEPDLRRATVFYTSLPAATGDPDSDELGGALAQHRGRLQAAIARQAHLKRTPELVFRQDTVIRQAERIEEIMRGIAGDERH